MREKGGGRDRRGRREESTCRDRRGRREGVETGDAVKWPIFYCLRMESINTLCLPL